MPDQQFPYVPPGLLEYLERLYPERTPEPDWDDRKIWMEVGARKIVRKLRSIYDEQVKDPLATDVPS